MQNIHNKTVITKKEIFKSQQIWLLKSLPIVLLVAAATVLLAFRIKEGSFVFESLPFAIIGGIITPFYILLVEILMAKQNKTLPDELVFEFDFDDFSIHACAIGQNALEKVEVKYSSIKKYKFEKKFINIFVDKNTSLLIANKGFDCEEDKKMVQNMIVEKATKKRKFRKNLKK